MSNTIVLRIADFLKTIPPFSFLTKEEQYNIAENIQVKYFDNEEDIFLFDNVIQPEFYVIKEGAVGLFSSNNQLSDECDEGDIFGLRALIREGNYKLSARAIEETILYCIPAKVYHDIISKNTRSTNFIIQNFANNLVKIKEEKLFFPAATSSVIEEETTAKYSKNPITCSEDTSIEIAAQIMTVKRVGSIIVVHDNKPIGIITDKDLRTKIATGKFSIKEKVIQIMSAPVICYPGSITVAEAQIAMLKNKITHLCITEDGTENSNVVGILSEHDIILVRENNPSVLIKEIKRSFSIEELVLIRKRTTQLLQRYLQQGVSINFITKIVSEINNTLTQRSIDLAIKSLKQEPPVSFAWLAIGSQGRKEQALLTDQDNAIVFEDDENFEANRLYFLKLAKLITESLHKIGFEYCPAEMMASNKKWCLSISEWQDQFKKWICTPTEENIMLCTIFFDFERIYGNQKLSNSLTECIQSNIKNSPIFLKFLGKNAIQNPAPLGFFRQFLVEQTGEHKDQFDIKARAMMPFVDASRLLCLSNGIDAKNTLQRFKKLEKAEPQNEKLYQHCFDAFTKLLKFRITHGFEANNSGRFISLSQLSKVEKQTLKNSFKALNDLQSLLQVRFQLSNMM